MSEEPGSTSLPTRPGVVGAIVAGLLIWWRGWDRADPIASAVIGLLIVASSVGLPRDAGPVLMQQSPAHVDVEAVRTAIESATGVRCIHDLHIWTLTSGKTHNRLLAGSAS